MLSSNVLRAVLTLAGIPGREMAEPMQSPGLATLRRVCQDLGVGAEAFPANRRPGAFQETQLADHVAEDRDDLRRAEAALAGCLVGLLVGREGVLELLQVDEAPCDLMRLVIILLALLLSHDSLFQQVFPTTS